jgi:superfamily II DNA or RNA helicase
MREYAWQKAAFERFVSRPIAAIIAKCGTGKTFAAIKIALGKALPVIIIAPGHTLCKQWEEEIHKLAGPDEKVWVYNRTEETGEGEQYQRRFVQWLAR